MATRLTAATGFDPTGVGHLFVLPADPLGYFVVDRGERRDRGARSPARRGSRTCCTSSAADQARPWRVAAFARPWRASGAGDSRRPRPAKIGDMRAGRERLIDPHAATLRLAQLVLGSAKTYSLMKHCCASEQARPASTRRWRGRSGAAISSRPLASRSGTAPGRRRAPAPIPAGRAADDRPHSGEAVPESPAVSRCDTRSTARCRIACAGTGSASAPTARRAAPALCHRAGDEIAKCRAAACSGRLRRIARDRLGFVGLPHRVARA